MRIHINKMNLYVYINVYFKCNRFVYKYNINKT